MRYINRFFTYLLTYLLTYLQINKSFSVLCVQEFPSTPEVTPVSLHLKTHFWTNFYTREHTKHCKDAVTKCLNIVTRRRAVR